MKVAGSWSLYQLILETGNVNPELVTRQWQGTYRDRELITLLTSLSGNWSRTTCNNVRRVYQDTISDHISKNVKKKKEKEFTSVYMFTGKSAKLNGEKPHRVLLRHLHISQDLTDGRWRWVGQCCSATVCLVFGVHALYLFRKACCITAKSYFVHRSFVYDVACT